MDKHIGAKVRVRRVELGLTQTQLADSIGITFQQIQKYEKGTNRVSGSKMWALCNLMQVDPNYFFEGLGREGTARLGASDGGEALAFLSRPDGARLMQAVQSMSPRTARLFTQLATAISISSKKPPKVR